MQTARGVKPPVFGDAEGGVVVPFPGVVLPSRAGGGYLSCMAGRRVIYVIEYVGTGVNTPKLRFAQRGLSHQHPLRLVAVAWY